MTTTKPLLELPAELERELNVLGVRRALFFRAPSTPVDRSFKRPVFDADGQPEF